MQKKVINEAPCPTVYSRLLLPVIISNGAVGLSIGLMIPLASIILEQRGISIMAIGFNATVFSLAVLVTGPFLPSVIHRIGLLKTMIAGALLSGVFVLGLILNDSLWFWNLLRFLMGITGGMHWVGSEAWVNAMAPEHSRGRIVGAYGTIWLMGIAAGPLLLKFIGVDGVLPFIVSGILMSGAALPLLIVPPVENNYVPLVHHNVFQMVYIAPVVMAAAFFSGLLETAVLSLLPIYGIRSGLETAYSLILVSFFAVGGFVFQPFIGWVADKFSFKSIALLVTAASVAVVPLVPMSLNLPLLMSALLFVWGGSIGGYYTLGLLNIGQIFKSSDLTAASSMFAMAFTVGMVVGPFLGSASMRVLGPSGLLVTLGMIPLFFIPLLLRQHSAAPGLGHRPE